MQVNEIMPPAVIDFVMKAWGNIFVRIFLGLLSTGTAFASGVAVFLGWNFVPLIDKVDLLAQASFTASIFIVFFSSIIIVFIWMIRQVIFIIVSDPSDVGTNEKRIRKAENIVCKVVFVFVALYFLIPLMRSGEIFWNLFYFCALIAVVMFAIYVVFSRGKANIPSQVKSATLAGAIGLSHIAFFFGGGEWAVSVADRKEVVSIFLNDVDMKKVKAKIFMKASNGLIVFYENSRKPVYLSLASIRRIETITD